MSSGLFSLIRFISFRHLRTSWVRSLILLLSIALGVAMLVGTGVTNSAVLSSFEELGDRSNGKADLQISAGETGVSQDLVAKISDNKSLFSHVAGRIEEMTTFTTSDNRSIRVLAMGIDFLGDTEFFSFSKTKGADVLRDPLAFLNDPTAVLISESLANEYGLSPGSKFFLRTAKGNQEFHVETVLAQSKSGKAFGSQVIVLFLDAAQLAFDRNGRVDRIDIQLAPNVDIENSKQWLRSIVDSTVEIDRPQKRSAQLAKMTASFRIGLQISGVIAIIVAMFLIYNAVSISVAQRRFEIGVLRSMGVTRTRVVLLFMGEALILAIFGSVIGIWGGKYLAITVVNQFAPNVSRFYENIATPEIIVTPKLALMGAAIGLGATLVGSLFPARQGALLSPIECLRQTTTDHVFHRSKIGLAIAGILFGIGFFLPLMFPSLTSGISALWFFIGASIFLTPYFIASLSFVLRRALIHFTHPSFRIGVDNVSRAIGRSSLSVIALMLATALSLTMSTYTHSYETSCLEWVEQSIPADIFVTAGSPLLDRNAIAFSPDAIRPVFATIPEIESVDYLRSFSVPYGDWRIEVMSADSRLYFSHLKNGQFKRVIDGPSVLALDALTQEPSMIISENLAYKTNKKAGDIMEIATGNGLQKIKIAAVVVDYSSDQGWALMDTKYAKTYWNDTRADIVDVYIKPGADAVQVANALRPRIAEAMGGDSGLFVTPNNDLKEEIRQVVRQTFSISKASEMIALIVAILGVVGTMLAAVLDRSREIAVLRAIGAQRTHVVGMVLAEAGFMGFCASLIGIFTSIPQSWIFVKVISVQSTGWNVPYMFPTAIFARSMLLILVLSALSGLWPALKASKVVATRALSWE